MTGFEGEFARHWDWETGEHISAGVEDAPDFDAWAYGAAEREPAPSWTVVVRQFASPFLGWPDKAYDRMFGIRFTGDDEGGIAYFEMLPGLDDSGLPFVHPNAPRIFFRTLPATAQARTWIEAGDAWGHIDERWFRWVPELREWYECPKPTLEQYSEDDR